MDSLLELAIGIERQISAARPRDALSGPVLGENLQMAILSAIAADPPAAAGWASKARQNRVRALLRTLRRSPGLLAQVVEVAGYHDALAKVARDTGEDLKQKRADPVVVELLRKRDLLGPPGTPLEKYLRDRKQFDRFVQHLTWHLHQDIDLLADLTPKVNTAVPFPIVQALELLEIRQSRRLRDPQGGLHPAAHIDRMTDPPAAAAAQASLLGLALSGGGIRSATFNLGIMQGLADLDLLRLVDYLSTVSGGGYIGGWLAAWSKRAPDGQGICSVQDSLSPQCSPNPAGEDQGPIRFLREYSNYLTPKGGFFTADSWTLVTEWVRNTLLNQLVLVLFLTGVMVLPHALLRSAFPTSTLWSEWMAIVAVLGFVTAVVVIGVNMASFDVWSRLMRRTPAVKRSWLRGKWEGLKAAGRVLWTPVRKRLTRPAWVQVTVVASSLVAAVSFTISNVVGLLGHSREHLTGRLAAVLQMLHLDSVSLSYLPWPYWSLAVGGAAAPQVAYDAFLVALLIGFGLLSVSLLGRFDRCFYNGRPGSTRSRKVVAFLTIFGFSVIAAWAGGALTELFSRMWAMKVPSPPTPTWNPDQLDHLVQAFILGPPLLLQVGALAVVIQVGLLGRNLPDERREWWSRVGAWVLIYGLTWILLTGLSLYGPKLLLTAGSQIRPRLAAAGGVTWVITTVAGLLSGWSAKTGPKAEGADRKAWWMNWVALAAPYVFVLGLLLMVSFALDASLGRDSSALPDLTADGSAAVPLLVALGCFVVAGVLSTRFDVNEFSMHHFYKNRLVRCYLGASRLKERAANPSTGFDPADDVKLASLRLHPDPMVDQKRYLGPYPIINAALNLVGGDNLAWQERKAESFVFTPQYCGYAYSPPDHAPHQPNPRFTVEGYRPTYRYAYEADHGIALGTAMAISGAAASPNMGHHSSPAVTFLMTMFNLRLGWWLGNPRDPNHWRSSSPWFGFPYLLHELLGSTTDTSWFVNLSDGGHFENLGLYELVRRGCRFIIASDAAQDPGPTFADLGNAIRKCRTDFGVEIDLSLERLSRSEETGYSSAHCSVGRIHYPSGDPGWILYIKTSLSGDESVDLLEYEAREASFPQQSTSDQWFDESQFESYCKLGQHIASSAFRTAAERWQREEGFIALFQDLGALWVPPTQAITDAGRKHAEAYDALLERVRESGLQDLDSLLFPGSHIATKGRRTGKKSPGLVDRLLGRPVVPETVDRDEFYLVASLIQLMETIFLDLNLDQDIDHPHNEGWLRIFRNWVRSPVLHSVWQDTRSTHSERFQRFCHQELKLP